MKTFTDLQEGVYDPNIFKAFFIAGGPGSGKSFVVRKTTGGLGMKIVNSDDIFEKLLDKEGLSLKMPESEKEPRDVVRQRAKELTAKKRTNFIEGRLGLLIDGTGKDYTKIKKMSDALRGIGYDTFMLFVNTSLDVAIERDKMRDRTLGAEEVEKMWTPVQKNMGRFQGYFGRENFILIDNNNANEDVFQKLFVQIGRLIKKEPSSRAANAWIKSQRMG